MDNGAAAALADWLIWRGDEPGALFYPTRKGGRLEARRMTDQAVLDILQQRGKEANLISFSPHGFRRTFISNLLDRGADISTVQKLADHASHVTTARYNGDRLTFGQRLGFSFRLYVYRMKKVYFWREIPVDFI